MTAGELVQLDLRWRDWYVSNSSVWPRDMYSSGMFGSHLFALVVCHDPRSESELIVLSDGTVGWTTDGVPL